MGIFVIIIMYLVFFRGEQVGIRQQNVMLMDGPEGGNVSHLSARSLYIIVSLIFITQIIGIIQVRR